MVKIGFSTRLLEHHEAKHSQSTVITLPGAASAKLPSRGMVVVAGTVNQVQFRAPLEPDGQGSHWFTVDRMILEALGLNPGDAVKIEIEPIKVWPEPEVPLDLRRAFVADPEAQSLWESVTPMARWDWIRWLDSVKLVDTRKHRPEKLCLMLKAGKRRPCCFNRAMRTPPRGAEIL